MASLLGSGELNEWASYDGVRDRGQLSRDFKVDSGQNIKTIEAQAHEAAVRAGVEYAQRHPERAVILGSLES